MKCKQFFYIKFFLFSLCFNQDTQMADSIVVGISSINFDDDRIIIDMFAINNTPIAGIQLDFDNNDLFLIDSVSGGRCYENKFTMYSNEKGRILAFSMKGNLISNSRSYKESDNSIFKVYGKPKKDFFLNDTIRFNSIIAGKKGEKLPSVSLPFSKNR